MDQKRKVINTKIFVRILPVEDMSHENIKLEKDHMVMYVRRLQDFRKPVMKFDAQPSFWRFKTDGIFFNVCQQEIYNSIMEDVVESVLAGCDGVVLTHGQTGSGKSYTIFGPASQGQQIGILSRLFDCLFKKKEDLKYESSITISMSMVEILRSRMKDLLTGAYIATPLPHRNPFKVVAVIPVQSDEEGVELLWRGDSNRSVAANAPHQNSHVAHAVITIHVENKSLVKSAAITAHSKLHLVDLAGVNSIMKPVTKWLSRQQVIDANMDQLLLGLYLAEILNTPPGPGSKKMFRNRRLSTLIQYLGDSLESSSLLRFIGHVIPDFSNLDSTLATLRFGEHIQGLQCHHLKFKTEHHPELLMQKLQEELMETQRDLQITRIIANLPSIGYNSQFYIDFTEQFIEKFVHGEVDEHALLTNLDPKIILQVFRDLHTRCNLPLEIDG